MLVPVLLTIAGLMLVSWQVILWIGWINVRRREANIFSATGVPVSLIVVARNEAQYLPELLASVKNQDFTQFECIIVLDRCTDNSLEIVRAFTQDDARFTCIIQSYPKFPASPKKSGLLLGIQQARYHHLVFTDGDCVLPRSFLSCFARAFGGGHQVILGSGMYAEHSGFLDLWIQHETLQTAATYQSMNGAGMAYMGVGRSLGYTRQSFEAADGFGEDIEISAGDDDLLVQRLCTTFPAFSMTSSDATSISLRKPATVTAYYRQKTRHISVSKHYFLLIKAVLSVFPIALFLFYTMVIWSIGGIWGNFGLFALGTIWLVRWPFIILVASRYRRTHVAMWFPLLDALNVVYYLLMLPATWTKKIRWK